MAKSSHKGEGEGVRGGGRGRGGVRGGRRVRGEGRR